MSKYSELKGIRRLSKRSDTNSIVDLVQDEKTGNLYVRKVIYGIDQPLYQGIFLRERPIAYSQMECCFNKQIVKDEVRKIVDKYDINTSMEGMQILDEQDRSHTPKRNKQKY